jgi:hypothetical protein
MLSVNDIEQTAYTYSINGCNKVLIKWNSTSIFNANVSSERAAQKRETGPSLKTLIM